MQLSVITIQGQVFSNLSLQNFQLWAFVEQSLIKAFISYIIIILYHIGLKTKPTRWGGGGGKKKKK
jgi:hypothetical protein